MTAQSLSFIPALSELSPLVVRVLGCNPGPMTLQGTNTYVVGRGKQRLLIDTGDGTKPEYLDHLQTALKKHSVSLAGVVLTHWHHDHIGGVEPIWNRFKPNCPLYKFPRPDSEDCRFSCSEVTALSDQQVLEVEGATIKEENAIFSGDCILGEGTAVFEDLYDYMLSLDKIKSLGPKVIYPAHGAVIEDPVEKIEYYIKHRNDREAQILAVLEDNAGKDMDAMDIVKIVYTETPEYLYSAAAKNVSHHLGKLLKEGKVEKSEKEEEGRFRVKRGASNL